MAGHSKWKQIKHKKAATDGKRSQVFGKLARLIAIESKKAGGIEDSPALRSVIERARAQNTPSEIIERAVQKGRSDQGATLEAVTYEAYGPGGVALIIEGYTDNKNRTAAEIRHLLSKHGIELAPPGAASWAFKKIMGGGFEAMSTVGLTEDDAVKLDALMESLEGHDDVQEVYTNAE